MQTIDTVYLNASIFLNAETGFNAQTRPGIKKKIYH